LCISRVLQRLTLRAERSPLSYADKLTITLDQWQRDVLSSQARQMLLNVTRQGGKSTISALLGLATIMAEEDQLVLIISPGERQSKLLFQKLMRFYHQLGRPVPAQTVNKLSLELINGSQVHALPGEEGTIRGFSGVNLLLMDEASRIRDEMNAAVRPMLAVSGGRTVAMSTPWGKRGWWWEAWEQGGD
jgi:phage terminase large subunit-like protein